MTSRHLLLCCAIVANLALTIGAGCATRATEEVANAAAVPLADTPWRLTQLRGVVVDNPEGGAAVGMQLLAQNTRLVGFSGCNRMFGGYALDGESLKFAQVGGTKMACADQARMQLEQRYLTMFGEVARWKITGRSLELLDGTGEPVAIFAAAPGMALSANP
jgi:heat shock protein HslJ